LASVILYVIYSDYLILCRGYKGYRVDRWDHQT